MMTRGWIPMAMIVAVAFTCGVSNAHCQQPLAPALYVFGASTVDAGNNKILRNEEKVRSFPYGVDLKDPTLFARASNGLTYADFIAEHLGLPLPPPVLSFKDAESRSKVLTGMNYASSASGILNHTGLITGKYLSFSQQIDLFERTVKEDLPKQIPTDLKLHLEESIILISIAENDYVLGYFLNGTISPQLDLNSYTRLLIQSFAASIERMVDLGAKRFVVSGMPPIGYETRLQAVLQDRQAWSRAVESSARYGGGSSERTRDEGEEVKFDDEGNKVIKITMVTRVRKLTKAKLSKRVIEHRNWPEFGDAVHDDVGSRLTMVSTEEIVLECPRTPGSKPVESTTAGDHLAQVGKMGFLLVCKTCDKKGDHWTSKCPNKRL
ncbi:hypothetical protein MLD38_007472 [Melastoma candidum]|uniref:Uncharacterized protein n=1 Tax=Melastoma candidum TaxID=119954 RepID=A0ACB9RR70_9MYRT|nr:hypothetical protein MLD38_007472 [Melastoma candidum]